MEQQITKELKDNEQKTIFLSYSRNDEEIADRIYRHLSNLPGIQELKPESAIKLIEVLKQYKDICCSMGEFLNTVADMNNPNIQKVEVQIEKAILRAKNNADTKMVPPPVHLSDTKNILRDNTGNTGSGDKTEPEIDPDNISLELVARQIKELKTLYITAENKVKKCEYATSDAADWVAYYKKARKKARKKAKEHLEMTNKDNGFSEITKAGHEKEEPWNTDVRKANEALSQAYENLEMRKKSLREAKTQSALYKKELSAVINLHTMQSYWICGNDLFFYDYHNTDKIHYSKSFSSSIPNSSQNSSLYKFLYV